VVHSATGGTGAATLTRTATCPANTHAIAGGGKGSAIDKELTGSYPSNAGVIPATGSTNPTSWTATFKNESSSNIAYAICVPN
jgi:hypothetical protein